MSKSNKSKKGKINYLPYITVAVVLLSVAIVAFVPKGKETAINDNKANSEDSISQEANTNDNNSKFKDLGIDATLNENGDVVIKEADITDKATFIEYKSKDGITVGLLAVRASDGTVRTAFDTCQVCNGSPYAFFVQTDNVFLCQNCGNTFSLDLIEQERGGCNPIPIMAEDKTVTDTEIIIPAALLEENAAMFENWKKF